MNHGPSGAPEAPSRRAAGPVAAPLWFLALITLTGTLAMHVFVPALPLVAQHFGSSGSLAQLTLSAYIVGLAVAQLVYGPLSDRFGRRPVLMAGMSIYAAASLVALASVSIEMLIVARFLEAAGGGAGLVLGRAIIRDSSSGQEAARRLSLMNLIVMAGPGLSPLVGAGIAAAAGWRAIFVALCALGLVNLYLVWRRLPETTAAAAHGPRTILGSYGRLLGSGRFIGYVIGGSCATTSIYAFIGAAPFIFIEQLHRPTQEVGLYLTVNFIGAWLGSLAVSRLAGRVSTRRLLVGGNLVSCAGALAFLVFVLTGTLSVTGVVLPMMLLTFGSGIASPTALSEALSVNPSVAGSASGIYGAVQMAFGAVCAGLSGLGGDPALAAAVVLTGAGVLAQGAFFLASRSGPGKYD